MEDKTESSSKDANSSFGQTKKMIVAGTMCLHNFIRENSALDEDFQICDRHLDYIPTIPR
jgi:hypothetical protein